jgi:hypothetical protein
VFNSHWRLRPKWHSVGESSHSRSRVES